MAENHTLTFSFHCSQSGPAFLVSISFFVFKTAIVLPCAVVVLRLGHQHWRSSATARHADVFTYNVALFDLVFIAGFLLFLCGSFFELLQVKIVAFYLSSAMFPGPVLLHILTCLERYLAVVHPVTYLRLRGSGGTGIRNVALVCAWLLCFGWSAGGEETVNFPFIPIFLLFGIALTVATSSSLRVLWVLIRPKPGEGGGASRSKLRAFQTMTAITGTMWMWFLGIMVSLALSTDHRQVDSCLVLVCGYWFTLPSNLVLPLLFLHRRGKFTGCKCNDQQR